jgi:hypothetical protein
MKKVVLALGFACLFMVACNNAPKQGQDAPVQDCISMNQDSLQPEQCCQMTEEQKADWEAFKAQWENYANLTNEEQVALVNAAKAKFDVCDSIRNANHPEGKACCQEAEMTEEQKAEFEAKKAVFNEKWANFSTLTLDEQKALIDQKMECAKSCQAHEAKQSVATPVAE